MEKISFGVLSDKRGERYMRDDITLLDENDTIDDIKNEVLYHVAKAAFEDNLDGILARLPYEILPGSKPSFRCCQI